MKYGKAAEAQTAATSFVPTAVTRQKSSRYGLGQEPTTSQSWQWWAAHAALGLVQQILTKADMELSVWMLSKQKM